MADTLASWLAKTTTFPQRRHYIFNYQVLTRFPLETLYTFLVVLFASGLIQLLSALKHSLFLTRLPFLTPRLNYMSLYPLLATVLLLLFYGIIINGPSKVSKVVFSPVGLWPQAEQVMHPTIGLHFLTIYAIAELSDQAFF